MIEIHKVGEIQQVLRRILIHPDIVYQENDSKWILPFLMRRVSNPVVGRQRSRICAQLPNRRLS